MRQAAPSCLFNQALPTVTLLFIALPAAAQVSSAIVRGTVAQASGPVAGATITARNTATGQTLRTTSRSDGGYVLTGLPPGTYRIEVQAAGLPASTREVTLRVGQTLALDLAPGTPTVALQTVTVTGTRGVESKSSEVGAYVSPRQMERLPQVTRNFLAFADLAPGVSFATEADGSTRLQGGAQNINGVNVFIDGVSQKNYVTRGGISGQDSSRGNPFPQSAISEYKVLTQNYKAEFDEVTSAAITAVTKSGTNELQGDVFFDHTRGSWRASTPAEAKAGEKVDSRQNQYGASLGGPIVKDRLHYFIAYEGKDNRDPQTVVPGAGRSAEDIPAAYRHLLGPVSVPFKEDLLFLKLDAALNDAQQLEFTLKYRDERETTNLKDQSTEPWSTQKDNDETRIALKHQYNADTWVNEARITYERTDWNPRPTTLGPGLRFTTGLTDAEKEVLNVGGGQDYQRKAQKGYAVQDDFTFTDLQWRGRHVVKMGVKVKSVEVDAVERLPYNPQYYIDITSGNPDPYKLRVGTALEGVGDGSAHSRNTQIGLYVQDDWEVNRHLTLNLGLRYDYERSPAYLDHETPSDVIAALNEQDPNAPAGQTYAQTLTNGGIDINDYISTGRNRKAFAKAWQPRLGFAYDLKADQHSVVYGGYGRSYDRNIFDWLQLEHTKGTFPTREFLFPDGTWKPEYYTPEGLVGLLGPASNTQGREVVLINNKLKLPFSDQFSLGLRQVVGNWNTDVGLSHVRSKNGFAFLLGNRRPDGSFFAPGTTWGPPFGNGVPGYGSLILGTSGLETRTNSLFLQAQKPYTPTSGWGVTLAYTYANAKENRQFGEHYSLDYPSLADYGWKQSSAVPKHRLVVAALQDLPWGLEGSLRLSYASGRPQYYTDCTAGANQCSIEQFKRGSQRQVDVALGKAFRVGAGARVRVRADVLNLFNRRNYKDYKTDGAEFGSPTGTLEGPPRTVKLSLGASW
ncbi:TonB-dependent receptor [Caldimonas brevitalea]|uniref:TonB-dependent transporter Oar-like beta-barrel domain-containing protein n=1 Tax=Caldimonas brevitalea TaxID=413882 RepID=A0A0G3BK95_9BURK|nr:TonB-dependent receptor [Caldimonas brevitalea]AKJ29884.1 hypothetical protein AAW51_3193 [Caldimonas brevitalea]